MLRCRIDADWIVMSNQDQDIKDKMSKHIEINRLQQSRSHIAQHPSDPLGQTSSVAHPSTAPPRPFASPKLFTPKSFIPPAPFKPAPRSPGVTPTRQPSRTSFIPPTPLFKPPSSVTSSVKEPEDISRETKQSQAKSFRPLVRSTKEALNVDDDTKLLFAAVSERLDTIVRSINELHEWNLKIEKNIIDRINALESVISDELMTDKHSWSAVPLQTSTTSTPGAHEASTAHDVPTPKRKNKKKNR